MGKLQGLLFALATVALVVVSTFFFSRPWIPTLFSDRGAIDHALWVSLVLTGVVFIATNLILAWFAWRYQDAAGARAIYWHDNPKLEWTWTLVTAVILFVILFNALGLWASINSPAPADAALIEVTGQQFAWNVRYPGKDGILGRTDMRLASQDNLIGLDRNDPASADDLLLLNQLYLPKDRPVKVRIRSMDVIHSFFLPNFRVKQDAMPGIVTEIWFTPKQLTDPDKPLEIACAEHCGLGHYRMRGQVHVVPASELDAAVAAAAQ
jgi:cytochrome c oxidase subunit II